MDLETHAALMDELFGSHPRAVPDGPVNPARYAKARPRIAWILREVHDQDDVRWRLSEFLDADDKFETYRRRWSTCGLVAKASHALLAGLDELEAVSVSEARDALRDIAVINLKKIGGRSSIDGTFGDQLADWLPYVRRQLDLLKPEVVICGGSYDWLPEDFAPRIESWTSGTRIGDVYWIRMPHPGQRSYKQATLYSELLSTMKRLGWAGPPMSR